jgi:hypothetical protein
MEFPFIIALETENTAACLQVNICDSMMKKNIMKQWACFPVVTKYPLFEINQLCSILLEHLHTWLHLFSVDNSLHQFKNYSQFFSSIPSKFSFGLNI